MIIRFLLMAGIATLPLYLRASGGLQLCHVLLVLYSANVVAKQGLGFRQVDLLLVALVAVITMREAFAMTGGAAISSMMPAAYALYSVIIFNALRRAISASDRTLGVIKKGMVIAGILALLGVVFIGYSPILSAEGDRAVGTFNNPNQLGYFAACMFSMACLLRLAGRMSAPVLMGFLGVCLFLAVASLSKAAIVSLGIATTFAGFILTSRRKVLITGWVIVVLLAGAAIFAYSAGVLDGYQFVHRIQGIGLQQDDSVAARGYILWFDHGISDLLFGLGFEGTLARVYGGHEVASTIAAFFVGYGLTGGLLFLSVMVIWGYRVYKTYRLRGLMLVCMPTMLFGLSHNGSRFTIFWILLAMSFALTKPRTTRADREIGVQLGSAIPSGVMQ